MALVLEAPSTAIKLFWESLLPVQNSEQACMNVYRGQEYNPVSFKDVHAQVHCTAGYLMRRGIEKGDHVALMAGPGLRYHVLNLALQYLGAINVTLPLNLPTADVERLIDKFNCKMLFVDEVAQFVAHQEFKARKSQLLLVVIGEDEVEMLDPDKIVTFDRVVTLGKAAWREDIEQLKAMKDAMQAKDLCSVLVTQDGKTQNLSMQAWMDAVESATNNLLKYKAKSVLNLLNPDRLQQRAYCFAAIQKGVLFWSRKAESKEKVAFKNIQPEILLLYPETMQILFQKLPVYLEQEEKGQKAIDLALEVIGKKQAAAAQSKKDPILNRLKYKTHNKKLYKRIRAKLGGKVAELFIDEGQMDANAKTLFEECGIVVRQA